MTSRVGPDFNIFNGHMRNTSLASASMTVTDSAWVPVLFK